MCYIEWKKTNSLDFVHADHEILLTSVQTAMHQAHLNKDFDMIVIS